MVTLDDLLDKKGLFAKGESEEIREVVVEALRKIGGPQGLKALKKIAIRDSSSNVRVKATMAIRSLERRSQEVV